MYIRRPLPSLGLGLGGVAAGMTVGVRHGPVPALASKAQSLSKLLYTAPLRACFAMVPRRPACLSTVPP